MYLVNEAGGGRPGGAFNATDSTIRKIIGGTSGQMASGGATGSINSAGRGIGKGIEGWRKWRADRKEQAGLPPGGSRY